MLLTTAVFCLTKNTWFTLYSLGVPGVKQSMIIQYVKRETHFKDLKHKKVRKAQNDKQIKGDNLFRLKDSSLHHPTYL